ncbi:MAG TPA: hypothetical protein VKZ61_14080 [Thermomicrobiales bacterium]|nr:hypothetical protein [Thermomicrobiales bacterium]
MQADAADLVSFDHGHVQPELLRPERGIIPAGARSKNYEIELLCISHELLFSLLGREPAARRRTLAGILSRTLSNIPAPNAEDAGFSFSMRRIAAHIKEIGGVFTGWHALCVHVLRHIDVSSSRFNDAPG